jgi:guanylate kinase
MKIVIVSGTTNAGKDDLINDQIKKLADFGIHAVKTEYFTTRKPDRPEDKDKIKYFISDAEFDQKVNSGEIFFHSKNSDYRVGTGIGELDKGDIIFVNISPNAFNIIQKLAQERRAEVYKILLTAPREQRVERMRFRENLLIYEPVEFKVDNDIVKETPELVASVDLAIENKDGEFNEVSQEVFEKLLKFINK